MQEIWTQTLSIIFGGAILALLTFVSALMWNLRKQWILDHAWQKEAQRTLMNYGDKFEAIMLKLNGIDSRVTAVEHPAYYRGVKRRAK